MTAHWPTLGKPVVLEGGEEGEIGGQKHARLFQSAAFRLRET
jgi:hypothetical protein